VIVSWYSEPSRLPRVWFCRGPWRDLLNKRNSLSFGRACKTNTSLMHHSRHTQRSISHFLQNGRLIHPQDINAPLHVAAERKINSYMQQYADNQNISYFSPRHYEHINPHARRIFASSFSTGPPGDRGALHCHWRAIATQPIGLYPFQAPIGLVPFLPVAERQSRTRGGQAAAFRINLNVEGCGIVAAPMHAPSRAPLLLPLLLSHDLPFPRVH
jgi:hypothetical protein